jgi:monothiol glutaredoxin
MSNPFDILDDENAPKNTGTPVFDVPEAASLNESIKALIASDDVFLFMKGIPTMPQCGFSANVVAILNHLGVRFKTFDILSDMDIRQGVKDYANWPTFPQLYVKSELIGGNDIVTEMYQSGELLELLTPYKA